MNFEHTEERRALANTLDRFIADRNAFEQRNKIAHGARGWSPELWGGFAELGAIGALFDEAHGGYGGSGFDISVVFESLGRGLVVEPFLGSLMAGHALAAAGDPKHLPLIASLADGSLIANLAHEDAAEPVKALRSGNRWILNGAKAMLRQAEAAALWLVSARTAGDGSPEGSGDDDDAADTLFLVPADAPGVRVKSFGTIDGGRIGDLVLIDVTLDDSAVVGGVGGVGKGAMAVQRGTGAGLLALCAEAVGAMDVARNATVEYLRTRKQFGVPIGSFQALQHRMATLLLEIEQARSAVINAAAAFDGPDALASQRALSAAKYSIGRIGALVAEECIQMHGGIGMTRELPLSHYAKRLVMIDHQLGDQDTHLERYIALSDRGSR